MDYYFGAPGEAGPRGPWGMIQGLQVAPPELIAATAPLLVAAIGSRTTHAQIYLLCIGHELPDPRNRVELDGRHLDRYGLPLTRIWHRYGRRDVAARRALLGAANRVLRQAGAWVRVRRMIGTFSHAIGTCRFGVDPERAALDRWCRVFGIKNLFVVDGSFMPSAGAVNPSLTIAANGLRVGEYVVDSWRSLAQRGPGCVG
jgi:choline dehydrogenase-like flavoprotein